MTERPTRLTIYVPAPGKLADIKPGSAIAGDPERFQGDLIVYYEGGVYHQRDWSEYLQHACGRLAERYPTAAMRGATRDELIEVAIAYNSPTLRAWVLERYIDAAALEAYVGHLPPLGGTQEQKDRALGDIYTRMSPSERVRLQQLMSDRQAALDHAFRWASANAA